MFEQIDDDDDVISELFQNMTSLSLCRVGGFFYKQLLKKNDRFLFLKMRKILIAIHFSVSRSEELKNVQNKKKNI